MNNWMAGELPYFAVTALLLPFQGKKSPSQFIGLNTKKKLPEDAYKLLETIAFMAMGFPEKNVPHGSISYPEQLATLFDFTDGRVESAIRIIIKRAKGLGSSLPHG